MGDHAEMTVSHNGKEKRPTAACKLPLLYIQMSNPGMAN
jgi:hypothetical protein